MVDLNHEAASSLEYAQYFAGDQSMIDNYADLDTMINGDWDFLMSCDVKQEVRPGAILALRDLKGKIKRLGLESHFEYLFHEWSDTGE